MYDKSQSQPILYYNNRKITSSGIIRKKKVSASGPIDT
jgi:hypothetical protein